MVTLEAKFAAGDLDSYTVLCDQTAERGRASVCDLLAMMTTHDDWETITLPAITTYPNALFTSLTYRANGDGSGNGNLGPSLPLGDQWGMGGEVGAFHGDGRGSPGAQLLTSRAISRGADEYREMYRIWNRSVDQYHPRIEL